MLPRNLYFRKAPNLAEALILLKSIVMARNEVTMQSIIHSRWIAASTLKGVLAMTSYYFFLSVSTSIALAELLLPLSAGLPAISILRAVLSGCTRSISI